MTGATTVVGRIGHRFGAAQVEYGPGVLKYDIASKEGEATMCTTKYLQLSPLPWHLWLPLSPVAATRIFSKSSSITPLFGITHYQKNSKELCPGFTQTEQGVEIFLFERVKAIVSAHSSLPLGIKLCLSLQKKKKP